MPIIFTGKLIQIHYENGEFHATGRSNVSENFAHKTRHTKLTPLPKTLTVKGIDNKQYLIDVAKEHGHSSAYRSYIKDGETVYEYFNNFSGAGSEEENWVSVDSFMIESVKKNFKLPDEQRDNFNLDDAQGNEFENAENNEPEENPQPNAAWSRDVQAREVKSGSQISKNQKVELVSSIFRLVGGGLEEIKQSCTSFEQYNEGLKYLIEEEYVPQNLPESLIKDFKEFKNNYFSLENFRKLPLNNTRNYEGHLANAGEVFTYARDFLIAELKLNQPDYNAPEMRITNDSKWVSLCSTGHHLNASTPKTEKEAKAILDPIMAVYNPENKPGFHLKDDVTAKELIKAEQAIRRIGNTGYETPTGQYLTPFVAEICKYAGHNGPFTFAAPRIRPADPETLAGPRIRPADPETLAGPEALGTFKKEYLVPLQAAIQEKLQNFQVDQPQANQFHPLSVDQFSGGPGRATHQDFVKFQIEDPEAILLIPDNFTDAALADNLRHTRRARGGLANPMAPRIVGGDAQNPVYNLCTFGIPTGGDTRLTEEEQKSNIKARFARLYGEVRRGRTIAVPQLQGNQGLEWAFGGGQFEVSPISAFVRDELTKLKRFCDREVAPENLDEIYQDAWNNPQNSLPLPRPEAPEIPSSVAPQADVSGVQADRTLLSAHMRVKFQGWFQANGHGELTHDQTKNTLTGTLSNGVGMVVYSNKILLHKSNSEMTDAELEESTKKIVDMYKAAYAPGSVPPLRAYGSDKQKEIISRVIQTQGVVLLAEASSKPPTANSEGVNEGGGMELRR